MAGEKLVPAPAKDRQPLPETSDIQQGVERLLEKFISAGGDQEVRQELETLQDAKAGEVKQTMFVVPNLTEGNPPRVGVALESQGRAEYAVNFYEGNPPQHGRVTVGEPHFTLKSQDKGFSGLRGALKTLSDQYDPPIIQAVANVFGRRILHSITARIDDQERIEKLTQMGYQRRRGYPEVYDLFYEPQVVNT